jgi:hypothetical protein
MSVAVFAWTFLISFAILLHDPIGTKVTWQREVAPIVQARCVTCHSPGGKAPMSLATYQEARPWARAIREEVLTRRMPKWPVVRGYGDFANDPSLSAFEVALIAAWVDGGAPLAPPRSTASAAAGESPTSGAPLMPAPASPVHTGHSAARTVTLPCASRAIPRGRLVGLTPTAPEGSSLRLNLRSADGLVQPLIWLMDVDPAFAGTYWLRSPQSIGAGARMDVPSRSAAEGPCRVDLHYANEP